MKKVRKFNEAIEEKGLSPYNDLWVVMTPRSSEFSRVYLSKEEAEEEAEKGTKQYYDHYRNLHNKMSDEEFEEYFTTSHKFYKYNVLSLMDGIDQIKEVIQDENDFASWNDASY